MLARSLLWGGMPVAGLVVTLENEAAEQAVLTALQDDPEVFIGERTGRHLALAVESPTLSAGERAFERLRELVGVLAVDVVFLDFSDAELGSNEGVA